MIAFGVFVLLVVGVIAGFAVVASDDPAVVHLLGFDLETTERWQFVIGALCALSAVVALRIIMIGWRRALRRRRELHELRETVSQQATPTSKHLDDRDHGMAQPEHKPRDHRDFRWTRSKHERRDDRDRRLAQPERDGGSERDHFDSTPHD